VFIARATPRTRLASATWIQVFWNTAPCVLTLTDILKDLANSIFRVDHPAEQAPQERGWLSINEASHKESLNLSSDCPPGGKFFGFDTVSECELVFIHHCLLLLLPSYYLRITLSLSIHDDHPRSSYSIGLIILLVSNMNGVYKDNKLARSTVRIRFSNDATQTVSVWTVTEFPYSLHFKWSKAN